MACLLIIFIIELFVTYQHLKKVKYETSKNSKYADFLLFTLPLLTYFAYFMSQICAFIDDFELTNISCLVWTRFGVAFWIWAKCFLYLLLIFRLYTVYNGTAFAYHPALLWSMIIITITQALALSYFTPIHTTVKISYHNNVRLCDGIVDNFVLGIAVFIDTFISWFALYLFLKPLNSIIKESSNFDQDWYQFMVKTCSLTLVMVFSTFIFLVIVGIFDITSIGVIDHLINCICIAFFNKKYDLWFNKCCYATVIFTKCITVYCCCCCKCYGMKSHSTLTMAKINSNSPKTPNVASTQNEMEPEMSI